MKFSYTLIKKFLPRVPSAKKLGDALNFHSFEVESAEGDVLEIKLPANRYGDASSHLGIAREASTIFGTLLKSPIKYSAGIPKNKGLFSVKVEEGKLCPRYRGRCFDIGPMKNSPLWMQKILKSCGVRPIHAIVDIMNYVMLETGQPLHAFDANALAKNARGVPEIIVRRARTGEKITTLDDQTFSLDSATLLIADKNGPLAIAGVKGGKHSGITKKTTRIIVEAANFDPVGIYETSRALKLATDASVRFQHGLSPVLAEWGMERATEFLKELGARPVDDVDVYPRVEGEEILPFRFARYASLIGAPVDPKKARHFFEALGFTIEKENKEGMNVRIPMWRRDIQEEEDLIEEISRLEGYGSLAPAAPAVRIVPAEEEDTVFFKDRVRKAMLHFALDEIYTASFVGDAETRAMPQPFIFGNKPVFLEIANPVAEDKKYVRPSLIPLLFEAAKNNLRYYDTVRIFEVGSAGVCGATKNPKTLLPVDERMVLGVVLASRTEPRLIFELKGIMQELLHGFGLAEVLFEEHGGVLQIKHEKEILGFISAQTLPKGVSAALAELDLGKLLGDAEAEHRFSPLPRFPSVVRDLSLVVDRTYRIGDVIDAVWNVDSHLIDDVLLIDEYSDEKTNLGRQSLTLRIIFRSDDRTLRDEEVEKELRAIEEVARRRFGAMIR